MNEELTRMQEPEGEVGTDLPEGRSDGRRGETARPWADESAEAGHRSVNRTALVE